MRNSSGRLETAELKVKIAKNPLLLFDFQSSNSVCSKVSEYLRAVYANYQEERAKELSCLVRIIFDMTTAD